eukprot:544328_1
MGCVFWFESIHKLCNCTCESQFDYTPSLMITLLKHQYIRLQNYELKYSQYPLLFALHWFNRAISENNAIAVDTYLSCPDTKHFIIKSSSISIYFNGLIVMTTT